MMPLCQFNLLELPYRPDNLADIALITLFIDPDELPDTDAPNSQQWCLRAYKTLDGLVEIDQPDADWYITPLPISWTLVAQDYPGRAHSEVLGLPEETYNTMDDQFQTAEGTKIGGWQFDIQNPTEWDPYNKQPSSPEYVFQVNTEDDANWMWGDAGYGYFGRGRGSDRDQWFLEWQCY